MDFNKEELKALRALLPPGANAKLAEKFSFKIGSIRNILSGLSNNEEVVLAAYDIAKAHQAKLSETKAALA